MEPLYSRLKEKARGCRDREIRVKLELILLALKLGDVSEACARRGYSRKYYYKWWGRLKKRNFDLRALKEFSRRPRKSPKKISPHVEKRIRFYYKRQYGARMIEALLARESIRVSRSTICHVLNDRGKSRRAKKKRWNPHRRRYELVVPGQRFQIDVKYVPELVQGKRVYAYVAIDECTRWRFVYVYSELNEYSTQDFLRKLKAHCPFPIHTIQTDQGMEFTFQRSTNQIGAPPHCMGLWCERTGIKHRVLPAGAKELNGKVERSHRIDEQYFYWRAPTDSLERLNTDFAQWINFYHHKRPHGGLGYQTPWEKLMERLNSLQNEVLVPELEPLRLKFLRETPTRLINPGQMLKLAA